jgi:fido (protein-threonine AMPylation protein)
MHRELPQDGNGRVSRLLASLPLIHAGYPPINVRLHKQEEYLQALFKVSYCVSRQSNDLKAHVSRRKLRRICSPSRMYLHLRC